MKKLLILTNPESSNTQLLLDNKYIVNNFDITVISHFEIRSIKKESIVTVDNMINLRSIDYIWLEFDWLLGNPNTNTHRYTSLLYTYHGDKFVYNIETQRLFHPFYDSKAFNASFLEYHGVSHPKTIKLNEDVDLSNATFPLVLKKDMSGRARDVELVHQVKELRESYINSSEWIAQELIPIKQELRVIVMHGSIVGAVEKSTKFSKGKIGRVRVIKTVNTIPQEVADISLKVADLLKADLVGLDVAIDESGISYVIEFNIGAALQSFIKTTGIDVVTALFEKRLKKDGI